MPYPPPSGDYEGLMGGIGHKPGNVTVPDPVCAKRSHPFKLLHCETHWVNDEYVPKGRDGSKNWRSHAQSIHQDPGCAFKRIHPPNKLASNVEMMQGPYRPTTHWLTEQKDHFQGLQKKPPPPFPKPESQVHTGDDQVPYDTTYAVTNTDPRKRAPPYVPVAASKWPLPARNHLIHGGPPTSVDTRKEFPRLTANWSKIATGPHTRNPILGEFIDKPDVGLKSDEVIRRDNRSVPPLRTLRALRPPSPNPRPNPGTTAPRFTAASR